MSMPAKLMVFIFQSTLSVRRATQRQDNRHTSTNISIHALRKESDLTCRRLWLVPIVFQSTLSVRRATAHTLGFPHFQIFQSTLSVRRATRRCRAGRQCGYISIHALRKESDYQGRTLLPGVGYFNPRSP